MARDRSLLFRSRDELCADLVYLRDRDGRPACAEGFLSDAAFARLVEQRRCPYSGSRLGRPMNFSALRQISAFWEPILGALTLLRSRLAAASSGEALCLWDLRRASVAGVALPGYVFYRADAPLSDGELPPPLGATSKILFDVVTVIDGLAEQWIGSGASPWRMLEPADATLVLDAAEASGAFIGPRGVCAAPPRLIREALDALSRPRPESAARAEEIAAEIGDVDAFFRYADAFSAMDAARAYHGALAAAGVARLREDLLEVAPARRGAAGARLLEACAAAPEDSLARQPRSKREGILRVLRWSLAQLDGGEVAGAPPEDERAAIEGWIEERIAALDASEPVRRITLDALLDAASVERAAGADLARRAARVGAALGWTEDPGPVSRQSLARMLGPSARTVVERATAAREVAR